MSLLLAEGVYEARTIKELLRPDQVVPEIDIINGANLRSLPCGIKGRALVKIRTRDHSSTPIASALQLPATTAALTVGTSCMASFLTANSKPVPENEHTRSETLSRNAF